MVGEDTLANIKVGGKTSKLLNIQVVVIYNPHLRAAAKIPYETKAKPRLSKCILLEAHGGGLYVTNLYPCTIAAWQQDKTCIVILFISINAECCVIYV